MSHLVEAYSRTTGLRIDKTDLYDRFFPITANKYIVIVNSTGMPGKNYPYWHEVLNFIKPALEKEGISIIQCGNKDDLRLRYVDYDYCGQTDLYQLNYIIKGALFLLSGDTSAIHIAGHYNIPFVALFGLTDPKISGAYFGDKDKQIYLEPDRSKHIPTFNPNDNSVRFINIEKTVDAIQTLCSKLSINTENFPNPFETLHVGPHYTQLVFEQIPDSVIDPQAFKDALMNLRGDLHFNENAIYGNLQFRKSIIITKQPLNVDILFQLKHNINGLVYEIEENTHNKSFVESLIKAGIPTNLITYLDKSKVEQLKLEYMDLGAIDLRSKPQKSQMEFHSKISSVNTRFKTNKRVLAGGKVFLSLEHYRQNRPISDFWKDNDDTIIDTPAFWEEQDFHFYYNI